MSEIEETAKATQEVAKTTNTAIETTRDFGSYMSQFFTPPLEQVSELITDKLKYYTWSNKLNLMSKAKDKRDKLGLPTQNAIPLKLGIPLLEAASLEEDDKLQELWANLLLNSTMGFSLERSYISVLEQLSSLEAKILIAIYSNFKYELNYIYVIDATYLPKYIQIQQINNSNFKERETILIDTIVENKVEKMGMDSDTYLSLLNLARLNCIEGTATHGAGTMYSRITPTLFGAKLYEAVKEPSK